MNKIKFLSRFLLIINILLITILIVQIIILVIPNLMSTNSTEDRIFGVFHHLIIVFQGFLLLFGLLKIQQALNHNIRLGLYNPVSEQKTRKGGSSLIFYGIISFLLNLVKMSELKLDVLINNLILNVFVSLVGIGLLILSDFIKKGMALKEEIDLTI